MLYTQEEVNKLTNEARIDENKYHLAHLSHDEARSYSVQKIRDRIRTLKKTAEAEQSIK